MDISKCIPIPYGFNELLMYFSRIKNYVIYKGGLKLNNNIVEEPTEGHTLELPLWQEDTSTEANPLPWLTEDQPTEGHTLELPLWQKDTSTEANPLPWLTEEQPTEANPFPWLTEEQPTEGPSIENAILPWETKVTDSLGPGGGVNPTSNPEPESESKFSYNMRDELMQRDRDGRLFGHLDLESDQTGSEIDGYDGYEKYADLYDFLREHELLNIWNKKKKIWEYIFIPLIEHNISTVEGLKTHLSSKENKIIKDKLIIERLNKIFDKKN